MEPIIRFHSYSGFLRVAAAMEAVSGTERDATQTFDITLKFQQLDESCKYLSRS